MIKISNLKKSFGKKLVLSDVNLEINEGEVFGLIGINGSGKSTLLRIICGIYKSDCGKVLIDNQNVYENILIKKDIFYLSDEPYYPSNYTISSLVEFYKSFYEIDTTLFNKYIKTFNLDTKTSINTFSKGMKRQIFINLALAIKPKYLILDEAFDGLDAISKLHFKKEIIDLIENKNTTIIIASHSLRELEDICETYGLIDNTTISHCGNIESKKEKYLKYQIAFSGEVDLEDIKFVKHKVVGKIHNVIIEDVSELEKIKKLNPILLEKIEVDLEEIFLIEVESRGYKI